MIQVRNITFIFLLTLCFAQRSTAQNNALILNGAYININGGTWANPVYLVVNNGQPAAISRASGHIISEKEGNYVSWITADVTAVTDYIFPFGYGNTDYLPVSIHKNSVGTGPGHTNNASAMIISTWGTPANNTTWANGVSSMNGLSGANETNAVIDRWWQIRIGNNVNATADVSYRGAENTTAAATGMFNAQEWETATSQFLSPTGSGTGVTSGIGSVTAIALLPQGLSTSSPFILSSSSSPLPIELISFTAGCENNEMQVNWKNATETNVMSIELQKSYDVSSWTTIYTANPSNTSTQSNYSYSYAENNGTLVYYRLKVNNNDGVTDISRIVSAESCASEGNNLTGFYYGGMLNFHSSFVSAATVHYTLYDVQGKKIISDQYFAPEGEQIVSVLPDLLPDGIYILAAESAGKFYNQKIIVSDK